MTPVEPTVLLVDADPEAVRSARRYVHSCCVEADIDSDTTDTAVLLASEVVTNAVIHGRSQARVRVAATARVVRVAVGDDNSRQPRLQCDDLEALDGRGLHIVDLLASRWGVEEDPVGKTVWFELDRP